MTTGELEYSASFQYTCKDCKTPYPVNTERSIAGIALIPNARIGEALCNGRGIDLCPWCRPDSRPWKHGRGI